jgi:hypothetical protein
MQTTSLLALLYGMLFFLFVLAIAAGLINGWDMAAPSIGVAVFFLLVVAAFRYYFYIKGD